MLLLQNKLYIFVVKTNSLQKAKAYSKIYHKICSYDLFLTTFV